MFGKKKCKILKEIRSEIAKANDINYVVSECKYQGECRGTCPKCEAEVRYLEEELEKRRLSGKNVAIAGVASALILTSGCSSEENSKSNEKLMGDVAVTIEESFESQMVDGQFYYNSSEDMGMMLPPSQEVTETTGDPLTGEELYITQEFSHDFSQLYSEEPDSTYDDETISHEFEILGEVPEEYFSSEDKE